MSCFIIIELFAHVNPLLQYYFILHICHMNLLRLLIVILNKMEVHFLLFLLLLFSKIKYFCLKMPFQPSFINIVRL